MKPIALAGLLTAMLGVPALAEERIVNFSVPGMFCASCPYVVQAAMGSVDGVLSVTADAEKRTALAVFDDAVTGVEAIGAASTNAGYEAIVIVTDS